VKIKRSQFDLLLEQALAEFPPQFAKWIDEVPIIVEDQPSQRLLDEMGIDEDGELLGSYNGVALTHRSVEESAHIPDHIMIFRRPLIAMCQSPQELRLEIRKTLLHELAHYAGLDEDDLKNLGYD